MKLNRDRHPIGEVFWGLSPEIQVRITAALCFHEKHPLCPLDECLLFSLGEQSPSEERGLFEMKEHHSQWKTLADGRVVGRVESENPFLCLEAVLSDPTNLLCPLGVLKSPLGIQEKRERMIKKSSGTSIRGTHHLNQTFKVFSCEERHQELFQQLEGHTPFIISETSEALRLLRSEELSLRMWESEMKERKPTRGEWTRFKSLQWSLMDSRENVISQSGRRCAVSFRLQPAGRLQEVGFGAYRLSEKRTNLRKGLLRDSNQMDLQAFDCSSSGWLLAAVLMGDEATYSMVQNSLNDTATEAALKGGFILHNEAGKGRQVIKKLAMTYLYGSKPHRQYLEASWEEDTAGVWRDIQAPGEFLASFSQDFPTFTSWLEHCKSLAGERRWEWPELWSGQVLSVHRPLMETHEILFPGRTKKPLTERIRQLTNAGLAPDSRKIKNALAPVIIHSLDAALLKFTLEDLLSHASEESVISPVHDCVIVSSDLSERVQDAWNQGLRKVVDNMPALRDHLGLPQRHTLDKQDLNVKISREY
jgi:hypothetical protein